MDNMPLNHPRWLLTITGAILAISTAAIFIKFAQQEDLPSLVIAALRLTLAMLLLTPLTVAHHRGELGALTRRELALALFAGLFLALHFAAWISSLEYTSVASSVVIVTTTPLWVALVSPFALKESLERNTAIGLGLALIGGVIVALSDACGWQDKLACLSWNEFFGGRALFGNLLALTGAWFSAGYLMIGRHIRAKLTLMPYIFIVYGAAALVLLVLMFGLGYSPLGYPLEGYLWVAALALIPQLLGHSAFNWALRYLPASFVSIALLGEPIGSTILAYFLLHETPAPLKLAGAALILAGIHAASLGTRQA